MIVGLDISTSCTGVAILNEDEDNTIIVSDAIKFNSDLSLEQRAENLKDRLKSYIIQYSDLDSSKVFVEAPLVLVQGKCDKKIGNANTTAMLNCFNGMVRLSIFQLFQERVPYLISARSARSKLGIKNVRGKKSKIEKKQPIIDFVSEKYKDTVTPFNYSLTRYGNPSFGTDDRADAIVLALSGPKLI